MTGTAHADVRSLTLPDWRTALKKRVRRPRRPSPWEILAVFAFSVWTLSAVGYLIRGDLVRGIMSALISSMLWHVYHLLRRGDESAAWTFWTLALVVGMVVTI